MSSIVKTIFGGTDRSAQRATQAQNEQARQFITQQMEQGQNYLSGAFDLYSAGLPQQVNALNQGYGAAQSHLLGGLPIFQNAIMGGPVDFAAYAQNTPITQIQYDPSVFQRPASMQSPQQMNAQPFYSPLMGVNPYGR